MAILVVSLGSCGPPDIAIRKQVIEKALTESFQVYEIPTGPEVRVSGDFLKFLKRAEPTGLVELRHPSWMGEEVIEVIATPKLVSIALNPDVVWTAKDSERFLGGEPGDSQDFAAKVRHNQAVIESIVTDEKYDGPLAAPGEKHRLVLGTFRNNPNNAAVLLGLATSTQNEPLLRFRCVMKYSKFNKNWSVVAFDIGSLEPEQWFTSRVH